MPPTWPWLLPLRNAQTGSLLLTKLPLELMASIGKFALGPRSNPIVDCMSFAMTCRILYDILRPLLNKRLAHHPRDWAGYRIICVSDSGGCRVPCGVLTPSELAECDLLEHPKTNTGDGGNPEDAAS